MKQKKVVHFTSVHPSFDVRIMHKECKTLSRQGYSVSLLAAGEESVPLDEDGVRVELIPRPRNRLERVIKTALRLHKEARKRDADIYHFHDPELIPVGLALRFARKKVIYDVHEDLPKQILSKPWIPPPLRRLVAKAADIVERLAARYVDGIVAATPAIAGRFPKDKTVVVQNFPLLSELALAEPIPYNQRPLNVVYVGGITAIRGAVEMVQAMELLPRHLPARLLMAGAFDAPALEAAVRQLPGWNRVEFLGWLDRPKVVDLLRRARVGLVVLHPTANYQEAYPVKMFEYMAAGIPVVASDFPLWRQIVEEAGCGLLVDPLDAQAIARAITWLLEHPEEAEAMGQRGRQAVLEKYHWEREAEKLLELYGRLA